MGKRPTTVTRETIAGCLTCHGDQPRWRGAQAQGTAAQHHDRHGHPTWCEVVMSVRYGRQVANEDQLDIEAAIGAQA